MNLLSKEIESETKDSKERVKVFIRRKQDLIDKANKDEENMNAFL